MLAFFLFFSSILFILFLSSPLRSPTRSTWCRSLEPRTNENSSALRLTVLQLLAWYLLDCPCMFLFCQWIICTTMSSSTVLPFFARYLLGQVCQESKRVLKCKESFLVTGSRPKWQYAAVSWYFGSRNAKDWAMASGRQSNSILRWKLIKHPKTLTDQLQQDEQTKLNRFRSHKFWEACFVEIQGLRVQES